MTQTATGIVTTSIDTAFTVPSPTEPLNSTANLSTVTAIATSLASIKAGAVTLTAVKTFTSAPDFDAGCTVAQAQAITAEGTGATLAGTWTISGNVNFQGGSVQLNEPMAIESGQTLTVASGAMLTCAAGSTLFVKGRKVWDRARVVLTDANHTVGVTQGDRFELPDPISPRLITLDEATGTPTEGERLTFFAKNITTVANEYTFATSGSGFTVAIFVGSTIAGANFGTFTWATFEFVSGVWRLAENSGVLYDGTASYGCRTGVGTHP